MSLRVGDRDFRGRVADDRRQRSCSGAPDLDAPVLSGDGHVQDIVLVDPDAARASELRPLIQKAPFLIEDLDPAISPVGDEDPSLRVHRQSMRADDLARLRALLRAPGLDELPVLRQLHDAVAVRRPRPRRVAIGDEDLAAEVDDNVGRSDEGIGAGDADSGLAERHEQLAVAGELEDLETLSSDFAGFVERPAVGNPDVAFGIHVEAVRLQEQPLAEALHELAGRVEHQNGDIAAALAAGIGGRAAGCRRAVEDPEIAPGVGVGVRDLAPGKAGRDLCPALDEPKRTMLRAYRAGRRRGDDDRDSDCGCQPICVLHAPVYTTTRLRLAARARMIKCGRCWCRACSSLPRSSPRAQPCSRSEARSSPRPAIIRRFSTARVHRPTAWRL